MTEHITKSDWTVEELKSCMAASPIIAQRVRACVNALAGLKPERLNGLVGAVKMIVDDNITMQGRCEQCDEVNSHESWCYVGILQTALAEVKVKK